MRRWIRRRIYRGQHRVARGELSTAQLEADRRPQLTPLEDLMPTMLVPAVGADS